MDAILLRAILAMDAYNRGYDQGLSGLDGTSIGSAARPVPPSSVSLAEQDRLYNLGSTGSLSSARTPKTHSCTRRLVPQAVAGGTLAGSQLDNDA